MFRFGTTPSSTICLYQHALGNLRTTAFVFSTIATVFLFSSLAATANASDTTVSSYNENKFDELINKMETDVIELATELEELYKSKCDPEIITECTKANYDHCLSLFPGATCPGTEDLHDPSCGDASSCSTTYSFESSVLVLHRNIADGENRNPTDPNVVESICFSKALDKYFIAKRNSDKEYWKQFGYEPSAMYFGSQTGAFRHYPAVRFKECGTYDPRVRPWYVAASSGPKNIVLILDTSGSMNDNRKIELLKQAAKRIVTTLTTGDRVAIVTFSTTANDVTNNEGFMTTASYENIEKLEKQIDEIEADGGTNFYDAFQKAFDILDSSIPNDSTVNCNTALLFLTDGIMTLPEGIEEDDVITLVNNRLYQSQSKLNNNPIYLFTYSIPGSDTPEQVDEFSSKLTCSVPNGVWSKIEDERRIVQSMASYYKLFALGLGNDDNEDFVAWVEPYDYASIDVVGTTVSKPVYDRSKDPHLFLGVVGVDFVMAALDEALGVTSSENDEAIRRVVARSTARCPRLQLTECELESYRLAGASGDAGLCPGNNNCTEEDLVQVNEQQCPTSHDLPNDLFHNYDKEDLSGCCSTRSEEFLGSCPASEDDANLAVIVPVAAGALLIILVAAVCLIRSCRRSPKPKAHPPFPTPPPAFVPSRERESPSVGLPQAVPIPSAPSESQV